MTFPITAYIEAALELARYNKLDADFFTGEIPKLRGATLNQVKHGRKATI